MSTTKTQPQTPHLQRFSDKWETKRVSEFGDIVTGETPSIKITAFWDGSYPWITPTDITSDRDMIDSERMVTQEGLNSIRRSLPPNTVLVTCIASIGKNAILKTTGSCNQQINAVVPNTAHNAEFLYYLFEYNSNYLLGNAGVTATPIISKSVFSEFVFQVPPLSEQRAIAEALSDVDGLLNALDALIAKKQAIKQATMQQLLTGKTRLPGFSGGWETKQIGDVVSLCSERNNLGADIPVLTCSKHLGFVDSLSYFKNQVFSKDLSGYKIIRRGQIGYPINHVEEGSIGLQDLYDVALVSPIYVVCSPKKDINSFFLHRLLKLESYRQEFANATTSSINRRGSLRWPAFSIIHVTLSPIDEQVAIAAVLNDVETEIAALEKRRDKTRAIKQGMMQQLLTGRVRLVKSE